LIAHAAKPTLTAALELAIAVFSPYFCRLLQFVAELTWIRGYEMAEFSKLTTIEQPVTLMGEMAAWSIMERLRKPAIDPPSLVLPTTLVVRNSTRRLTPEEQTQ